MAVLIQAVIYNHPRSCIFTQPRSNPPLGVVAVTHLSQMGRVDAGRQHPTVTPVDPVTSRHVALSARGGVPHGAWLMTHDARSASALGP